MISGRTTNMCERAIADELAEGFCSTMTPAATWPLSDSMNGKVVPSTVYKVRSNPPLSVPGVLLVPVLAEIPYRPVEILP